MQIVNFLSHYSIYCNQSYLIFCPGWFKKEIMEQIRMWKDTNSNSQYSVDTKTEDKIM